MSGEAFCAVWDYSKTSGEELLVFLAIGDNSGCENSVFLDDDLIEHLAERGRVTVERVHAILRSIVASGEMSISDWDGSHVVNIEKMEMGCVTPNEDSKEVELVRKCSASIYESSMVLFAMARHHLTVTDIAHATGMGVERVRRGRKNLLAMGEILPLERGFVINFDLLASRVGTGFVPHKGEALP